MNSLLGILAVFAMDAVYVGLAVLLVSTLGFRMITHVMMRGVNVREALFDHDNPVAGLEVGGMLCMLLYLGHAMIVGESVGSFLQDLVATAIAIVAAMVLMAIVRFTLGVAIKAHNGLDLNHEIFEQKNWAAACSSLALSMGVVNGITEENILGETPLRDLVLAATVMAMGLSVVWLYSLTHLKGRGFAATFYTDDNPAAGVSLLGFALAANIVFYQVVTMVKAFDGPIDELVGWTVGYSAALLGLLVLCRVLIERAWRTATKVDVPDEILGQKNVGAGFIEALISVGLAAVVTGAMV